MTMMKKKIFNIPYNPFGKQRVRHAVINGRGIVYTPKETKEYEKMVADLFKQTFPDFKPLIEPIEIIVTAYYPIPKSTTKKNTELMLANLIRPTKKPDSDNIEKIIYDALNGVAFSDDALIVDNHTHKYYSNEPRVEVIIELATLGK